MFNDTDLALENKISWFAIVELMPNLVINTKDATFFKCLFNFICKIIHSIPI